MRAQKGRGNRTSEGSEGESKQETYVFLRGKEEDRTLESMGKGERVKRGDL